MKRSGIRVNTHTRNLKGSNQAMVGYRRNFVAGGTYFFTVALQDRTSSYLIDYNNLLLQSVQTAKKANPALTKSLL